MTVGRLPIQITMLGAVLLTGCTQEPIVRNIELAAAPVPPSATSRLDQSSIVVETDNVEALASGHRLVIWAVTEAGLVALGPMIPGTPAEVSPATAAITLSDVRELVVTEEANSATLPVEASQVVVLRGPVEGTLHFGDGVGADAFATAHGTARIEDDRIDVTLEELPPLPVGYEYVAWLHLDSASGESHAHLRPLSGDHSTETTGVPVSELTLLGSVDVGITRFEPGRALYGATECRITIESLRGIAAASTATALLGQFELAEGSDEPSDGHLH